MASIKEFLKLLIPQSIQDFILDQKFLSIYRDWEKQGKPVPSPHKAKQYVIAEYAKKYKVKNLIETGTHSGLMVNAMKGKFRQIYSIELSKEFYIKAKNKFKNYNHIKLYQGDSAEVLPKILNEINSKSLFWLDGHYSGQNTAKGNLSTPVMDEIKHIISHSIKNNIDHIILIDDARCFDGTDDYPKINVFKSFIQATFPQHKFSIEYDIIRIEK